jgi:hypothetical protein
VLHRPNGASFVDTHATYRPQAAWLSRQLTVSRHKACNLGQRRIIVTLGAQAVQR